MKQNRLTMIYYTLLIGIFVFSSRSYASADGPNIPGYHWVGAWESVATDATPVFNDQTIRTVAHLSISSPFNGVRIRLTNSLSNAPITLGEVHAAKWAGSASNISSAIVPGTDQVVTFGGSTNVTIAAGGEVVSDPVSFLLSSAQTDIAVSVYIPAGNTTPATEHAAAFATTFYSNGNQTASTTLSVGSSYTSRPFVAGVDIAEANSVSTVVALGDSITDGAITTNDANARWVDLLGARLQSTYNNQVGIVNAGIGGNRILLDGYGQSAQARFNRDVLAVHSVKYVILLEGINDLNSESGLTAAQLIAGMRNICGMAHAAGLYIYGGTIMPDSLSGALEQTRQTVNAFIRGAGAFDGVIDFDQAVASKSNPAVFNPSLTPDGLHPNNAGSQVMANAVDLRLFNPGTH